MKLTTYLYLVPRLRIDRVTRSGRTLPPGKTRYSFYRRLDGPQGRSGQVENLVPTGIRSRTVQPVVSRYDQDKIKIEDYKIRFYALLWQSNKTVATCVLVTNQFVLKWIACYIHDFWLLRIWHGSVCRYLKKKLMLFGDVNIAKHNQHSVRRHSLKTHSI